MSGSLKSRTLYTLRIALAFSPWVVSMYVFYWLDASGTWTIETPHRGKLSVAILAVGMLASFLLHTQLPRRDQK